MADESAHVEDTRADRRAELLAELRFLCRGWGVHSPDLTGRLGPRLAEHLRQATDRDAEPRSALIAWLGALSERLPDDLREAAHAALGLEPRSRFLHDRQSWLSHRLDREARTARRRMDEALRLLAEAIDAGGPAVPARTVPDEDWYLESVRTLLRLDLPAPAVQEERRIVVTAPALERITVAVSLPRLPGNTPGTPRDLKAEVLFGGILTGAERPSESHFRFQIQAPRPLRAGERHSFGIGYTMPVGQPMVPHYALTPLSRCDEFRLRVRFAADRPPSAVWLLDGLPPRILDDDPTDLPPVRLDAAGEAEAHFTNLARGLGYGFRWRR